MSERVLQTIVALAVETTGARDGFLLAAVDGVLEVRAAGGDHPAGALGRRVDPGTGIEGFVLASGQPQALTLTTDDPRSRDGLPAALGRAPASILCVPCGDDDTVAGVLLLLDGRSGAFTFDDVELATLLGTVAGSALAALAGPPVPTPAALGAELQRLQDVDPARYAAVAEVVRGLISRG